MKASDSRQYSSFASLVLTFAGIILVLAFLLDCILLFFPSDQPSQLSSLEGVRWQVNLLSQIVDRGIVPLMGLVLIVTGLWIESIFGTTQAKAKPRQNLAMATFIFASLLGLIFLLIAPLHASNAYRAHQKTLEQLKQEAGQAENQLNTQLETRLGQERAQVETLLNNEQLLQQALSSGQLPPQQAELFKQFKANPKALDDFIGKRAAELRKQLQTEVRGKQVQTENQSKVQYLRSGLRISILSLLLAIGYITIGWTGLKNIGVQRTTRRSTQKT
jgi:hypothetical protein